MHVADSSGKTRSSKRRSRLTEPAPPWIQASILLCCSIFFFWLAAKELLSGQIDNSESMFAFHRVLHLEAERSKFLFIVCLNLLSGAWSF